MIPGLDVAVVAVLAPIVSRTAQEAVRTLGEVAYEKAKGLLEKLKARFTGPAKENLEVASGQSDLQRLKEDVRAAFAADPQFESDIAQTVEQIGPQITVILDTEDAKKVLGGRANEFLEGRLNVNIKAKNADEVTGFDLGTIGRR